MVFLLRYCRGYSVVLQNSSDSIGMSEILPYNQNIRIDISSEWRSQGRIRSLQQESSIRSFLTITILSWFRLPWWLSSVVCVPDQYFIGDFSKECGHMPFIIKGLIDQAMKEKTKSKHIRTQWELNWNKFVCRTNYFEIFVPEFGALGSKSRWGQSWLLLFRRLMEYHNNPQLLAGTKESVERSLDEMP